MANVRLSPEADMTTQRVDVCFGGPAPADGHVTNLALRKGAAGELLSGGQHLDQNLLPVDEIIARPGG
jgi:hypothetical protein